MKKAIFVLMAMVMTFGLLTGCGSDPVAEELEKFLNTDMVGINAKYEDLKAEVGKWDNLEDDAALVVSINDVILPNLDSSLELLSKIQLQTEEVKEIKDKYQKVLEAYKEGYQSMQSAAEKGDTAAVEAADAKIEEGVKLLDEYNKSVEDLAAEKDMTVEY
ncbi:MAG TPA: hypothetical protein PK566_15745 [Pseudobacteroides sp.]|nr:hypothetical protein [Pseudobacteroides sp.]